MGRIISLKSHNSFKNIVKGTLVRFKTNNNIPCKEVGIVIECMHTHMMSDILWHDGISTCDWEDLEVINESNII